MKSRQFCSVCKQWLDMEVVPTGDGDDDGVVWFRCPQCQGFLPKLGLSTAAGVGTEDTKAVAGNTAGNVAIDEDRLAGGRRRDHPAGAFRHDRH